MPSAHASAAPENTELEAQPLFLPEKELLHRHLSSSERVVLSLSLSDASITLWLRSFSSFLSLLLAVSCRYRPVLFCSICPCTSLLFDFNLSHTLEHAPTHY